MQLLSIASRVPKQLDPQVFMAQHSTQKFKLRVAREHAIPIE
jgi:hypothetical protein